LSFQDVSMGIDPFRLVHSLELLIVGIISVVLEWTFVVVQKCQRIVVIHVTDIVIWITYYFKFANKMLS
jgi:hypothetical protein